MDYAITYELYHFVYNSNLMSRKKIVLNRGPKLVSFNTLIGCFYQRNHTKLWALGAKLKAYAGNIRPAGRMLGIPDLDH